MRSLENRLQVTSSSSTNVWFRPYGGGRVKCRGATTSFLSVAMVVLVTVAALHVNVIGTSYCNTAVEACLGPLGDKRWMGMDRPWGGHTCRCPGVRVYHLQVKWAVGKAKEREAWHIGLWRTYTAKCMMRSRILYNVTQNNGGVEDPQYLSDLAYF